MTDAGTIVHCRDLRNAMSHSEFAGDLRATLPPSSFQDAPLGAGPESILTMVVMDSGLALSRAPE
jgi:hypothetical protein